MPLSTFASYNFITLTQHSYVVDTWQDSDSAGKLKRGKAVLMWCCVGKREVLFWNKLVVNLKCFVCLLGSMHWHFGGFLTGLTALRTQFCSSTSGIWRLWRWVWWNQNKLRILQVRTIGGCEGRQGRGLVTLLKVKYVLLQTQMSFKKYFSFVQLHYVGFWMCPFRNTESLFSMLSLLR